MDFVTSKNYSLIKEKLKEEGKQNLHVLADFDRTLTKAFVNGKRIPSLISVLRDENYLTPDYPEKAKALYEKNHTIEKDPDIPKDQKRKEMRNWWTEHFALLIKSGLARKDVERAMESTNLSLRDGCPEFLRLLEENNIPLVILSSGGLGKESIEIFLEKRSLLYKNVAIISNAFEWDVQGRAKSIKEPIIHAMNKNETAVSDIPEIYEKVKDRKNILLLGDSISDIEMAEGFDYDTLMKIGFLNEDIEENLDIYKNEFDAVILNDSSMSPVNKLLEDII